MSDKTNYLWDNSAKSEVSQRFNSLESIYDPITFKHMEGLGVKAGWKCLEVGGGGGSVSQWLASKVGSSGRILVTDINPVFLNDMKSKTSNIDILKHDVTSNTGIPKNMFDLAHARLVLVHLTLREKALSNMVSSLKSGGWVLIEDFDLLGPEFPLDYHPKLGKGATMSTELYSKIRRATMQLLTSHGADLFYARRLYSMMRSIGLVDVGISIGGHGAWRGGTAGANINLANSLQSKEEMIATGIISKEEFEEAIKMMSDPEWQVFSFTMVSAWGCKP